jgi:hypothetical protein
MNFARFALPLGALAYLPMACSSDTGPDKTIPAPPKDFTAANGGSGGASAAGSGGAMTSAGSTAGGTGGGGGMTGGSGGGMTAENNGMSCMKTSECPTHGFVCRKPAAGNGGSGGSGGEASGICTCSNDKPSICGTGADAACVNLPTDPDNCGKCGTKCDSGATCVAGKCGAKPTDVVTATGCGGGVRMALGGTNLYWTEKTTGKVRSVAVAGGAITDVATAQSTPTQIVTDATAVYWANQGDGKTAGSSAIFKRLVAANSPAAAAIKTATGTDSYPALAIGGDKLYYALKNDVHQISNTGTGDIVVGTSVNYDDPNMPKIDGSPTGIAVNATRVLFATPLTRNAVESHTLVEITDVKGDTGYSKLAKSIGALLTTGDVAADATYGYWIDGEKVARNKMDAKEPIPETITPSPDSKMITAFVITDKDVYASLEDGRIFKHSITPPADPNNDINPPVPIARDQMGVTSFVVDGTKLYWVTTDCQIRSAGL